MIAPIAIGCDRDTDVCTLVPKAAMSVGPSGTVDGVQFPAVFQSPEVGA